MEISAGGVVYRKQGEQLEIQLIRDRFGKVTLAKGKMEAGETVEQTALREIEEETGIVGELQEPLEVIEYEFESPEKGLTTKKVHYFLVQALKGSLQAQVEEIQDVACSLHEKRGSTNKHMDTITTILCYAKHYIV